MSWVSEFLGTNLGIADEGQDNLMIAAAIVAAAYGGYAAWGGAGAAGGGAAAGGAASAGGTTAAGATAAGGAGAAAGATGGGAFSGWGTAALGAGMSMYGQQMANTENQASAKKMMDFQSAMSSTAHQREVIDLKLAGLNPILSANAGSSTPSGAMSTSQNIVAPALESAISIKNADLAITRQAQEIKNMKSSNSLTQAQIAKTFAETQALGGDAAKGSIMTDIYNRIREGLKSSATPEAKTRRIEAVKKEEKIEKKYQQNKTIPWGKGY